VKKMPEQKLISSKRKTGQNSIRLHLKLLRLKKPLKGIRGDDLRKAKSHHPKKKDFLLNSNLIRMP